MFDDNGRNDDFIFPTPWHWAPTGWPTLTRRYGREGGGMRLTWVRAGLADIV